MSGEGRYHRPMIATDLDDARTILPVMERIDPSARIVLLTTYAIPFAGLRALFGAPRLERALAACSWDRLHAWVTSSGLSWSRFELVARPGEPGDQVLREVRDRHPDLVVLAYATASLRKQDRIATRIVERAPCDLVIARTAGRVREAIAPEPAVVLGPWPS